VQPNHEFLLSEKALLMRNLMLSEKEFQSMDSIMVTHTQT